MWESLEQWLSGSFMPHGHCYLWTPVMVWLQVISNLVIGLAYVSISTTLYIIIRRIRDIPFSWMYIAFGIFIITCGCTHLLDVVTIWRPVYWLDGSVRALTAIASAGTALLLVPLVPKAVALANAAQVSHERGEKLEATYRELAIAHEKATELERLKTQLFANVSHELRTPLTLVLGPAARLREAENLTAEQRRDLEVIERNARLLLKHVNDLLDVAKLEAGRMSPDYARVDIAALVRRVADLFESAAHERGIELRVDAPASLEAEVDSDKIERVLANLLSNAFKFTPPRGTIRVTVTDAAATADATATANGDARDSVHIEVADSGPGIPAAQRDRVFERFSQVDAANAGRGGTGLGLAIAREFAELHGGALTADAAPEGGALLAMRLPLRAPEGTPVRTASVVPPASSSAPALIASAATTTARAATASTSAATSTSLAAATSAATATTPTPPRGPEPSAPDASSVRATNRDPRPLVLVVEDNAEMNDFITSSLGSSYRTARAYDGAEGAELARQLVPDAIVTDVMMPRMTGDELVAAIRKVESLVDTPVLVLTAKADDDLRARLLAHGAQDYVMKPFSPEELRARVKNLVAMKRARDVLQQALASKSEDIDALADELDARARNLAITSDALAVARDHAERASSMKSSFLGMVSHELRTPLTAIQLLVDRLLEDASLSAKARKSVERMASSVTRLAALVDSLLQFARLQHRTVKTSIERVDLGAVVADLAPEFETAARNKGLAFEIRRETPRPGSGSLVIESDLKLVRLVLATLLENAVKFTEEGGITVTARVEGPHGVLRIEDTGPGISDADRARIFEPFHHVAETRHKHVPGVGLGLSLVREIVDNLGGKIEVRSAVGKGSTFIVTLPVAAARAA